MFGKTSLNFLSICFISRSLQNIQKNIFVCCILSILLKIYKKIHIV
jgi:hypothetical protein